MAPLNLSFFFIFFFSSSIQITAFLTGRAFFTIKAQEGVSQPRPCFTLDDSRYPNHLKTLPGEAERQEDNKEKKGDGGGGRPRPRPRRRHGGGGSRAPGPGGVSAAAASAAATLQRAVGAVASAGDLFGATGGPPAAAGGDTAAAAATTGAQPPPQQWPPFRRGDDVHELYGAVRRVAFGAKHTSALAVNDSGRLHEYMTLPVERYSVLDGEMISRLDNGTFRLTVPLDSTLSIGIIPELDVTVSVDPEKCATDIRSIRAVLYFISEGERHPLPPEVLTAGFRATLSWDAGGGGGGATRAAAAAAAAGRFPALPQAPWRPRAPRGGGGGGTRGEEGEVAMGRLKLEVQADAAFRSRRLDAIPVPGGRAAVGGAGRAATRALLGYLTPRFLALLEEDYRRFNSNDTARNVTLPTARLNYDDDDSGDQKTKAIPGRGSIDDYSAALQKMNAISKPNELPSSSGPAEEDITTNNNNISSLLSSGSSSGGRSNHNDTTVDDEFQASSSTITSWWG